MAEHVNSQGEKISIERVPGGPFAGQWVLIVYDDGPLATKAPMLLDTDTAAWLVRFITFHHEDLGIPAPTVASWFYSDERKPEAEADPADAAWADLLLVIYDGNGQITPEVGAALDRFRAAVRRVSAAASTDAVLLAR